MNKALLGLSNSVALHVEKIRLWCQSFRRHCDDEIILLVANPSQEDLDACKSLGIRYVSVTIEDCFYINHERLTHICSLMKSLDVDVFIVTDVFDVVFQNDPFLRMDLENYDIFVSGEGVNVSDDPWNFDNVGRLFPDGFEVCHKNEIICSGVIAGKKEAMIKLYERMYELCNYAPNVHNIKDQAALIHMICKNEIPKLKIFNLDDAWAVHCAIAGPTQFFIPWGFVNALKHAPPKLVEAVVRSGNEEAYDIVHQFNRVPEWDSELRKKNLTKTSVSVSSYYRTMSGDGNKTILDFVEQEFENFFVLFDNKNNLTLEEVTSAYNGAEICLYSDLEFDQYGFNKPIDKRHRWGSHQNPNYFYAHFRMLIFYLKNPDFDYYWFFDDDVTFTGNLKPFLSFYDCVSDDFLAIQAFKKKDYEELPRVSVVSSSMRGSGGNWLDFAPGPGDNYRNKEKLVGCFFPIVRFSNRAMKYLFELHQEGFYGYSEGFVPTSLASGGFKVASLMDENNNFFLNSEINCELYHKGDKFTWEWL